MSSSLRKRLATGLALGALLYLGLAIYAGWSELHDAISSFRWLLLGPILLLSLANYAIRFGRWQLYLARSDIRIPGFLSLRIFLCGLVMSVTPGKMGELLKAYLVKLHTGTHLAKTGPVVVAERVTDLVALVLLLFAGSVWFRAGWIELAASGSVTLLLILSLASSRVATSVIALVSRLPGVGKYAARLERAYVSMRFLLRPTLLLQATGLAVAAWFAECLGFGLVLQGFGIGEAWGHATFIYALSTLVGALLLLPGGLGGTEASMVALLVAGGALKHHAVGATFVTRVATLWFAVLLGALVLLGDRRLTIADDEIGRL